MAKKPSTKKVSNDLATWQEGWHELVATQTAEVTRLSDKHVDQKAHYIFRMSGMTGLSNADIATALDITPDYVGKMITRGSLIAFGFDGSEGARLVKATGNGITVTAIRDIVEGEGTKAEKVAELAELGLVTQEQAKRNTEGPKPGKSREDRTKDDLVALARIVNRAIAGDTNTAVIWEALVNASESEGFRGLTA
jgi:hypothetical protein